MDNLTNYRHMLQENIDALKSILALPVHAPKNMDLANQLNYETARNNAQKVLIKAELALSFEVSDEEIQELCQDANDAQIKYNEAYTRYVVIDFEQFDIAAKRIQKTLQNWDEHLVNGVTENEKIKILQQVNALLASKNELIRQEDVDFATNKLVQINQLVLQNLHRLNTTVEAVKSLIQRAQIQMQEELDPYVRYTAETLKTYHQFRFQLKQALEKAEFTIENNFSSTDLISVKEALEMALTGYGFSKNSVEVLKTDKLLHLIEQLELLCNTPVNLTDKTYDSAKRYTKSKLEALEVAHQARLISHQAAEQDELNRAASSVLGAISRLQTAQNDLMIQLDTVQLERLIYLIRHHIQLNETDLTGYSATSIAEHRVLLNHSKEHCQNVKEVLEKARSQEEVDSLTQESAKVLESLITAQANLKKLDDSSYRQTLQLVRVELDNQIDLSDKREDSIFEYEQTRLQLMSLEKIAHALMDKMSEQDEIDSVQQELENAVNLLVEARGKLIPKVTSRTLIGVVDALENELLLDENKYSYDTLNQFKDVAQRLFPIFDKAKEISRTSENQEELDAVMQQLDMARNVIDELKTKLRHLNSGMLEQVVAELKELVAEFENKPQNITDEYRDAITRGKDYLRIIDTIQQHKKTQAVIDELVSVVTLIVKNIKNVKPI